MDKNTIREICDVVTDEVMRRVAQKQETLIQKMMNDIQQLQSKNAELEEKIRSLESERIAGVPVQTTSYNGITKPNQGTARTVDGITTLSAEQMDEILSLPCFYREGNGWIYYIKATRHSGELYKVRPDGTENQKIFSGKVEAREHFMSDFKLNGDMISFKDSDWRTRTIKV